MDKQRWEQTVASGWGRLGRWRTARRATALGRVMAGLGHFALAALLARGQWLALPSPFAVAYVAACCQSGGGFAAALGAFAGYFFTAQPLPCLQYSAAVLLCFTAQQVLRDSPGARRPAFAALTAGAAVALTGGAVALSGGLTLAALCQLLTTVAVAAVLGYFFSLPLSDSAGRTLRLAGSVALTACALVSVMDVTLWGVIAPARVGAVVLVLAAARYGGFGRGAAAGVGLGVLLDAAGGQGAFFSCTYGFSALISGAFCRLGKTGFLCLYALANATTSLLGLGDGRFLSGLYESFVASVVFFLIPDGFWSLWGLDGQSLPRTQGEDMGERTRRQVRSRVTEISHGFHQMYLALTQSPRPAHPDSLSLVFDRACDRVCLRCVLRHSCWQKEYLSTRQALTDASAAMARRGRAEKEDFPLHFSSRCVRFAELLLAVNEGLSLLQSQRQLERQWQAGRQLLAQQYQSLTQVLRRMGAMWDVTPQLLPGQSKKALGYARAFGPVTRAQVLRQGPGGQMRVEIAGAAVAAIQRRQEGFTGGLAALLEVDLLPPEQMTDGEESRLIFRQKPPFAAQVGLALSGKPDSPACGDAATWFITEEQRLCLLLSDGMGSGPQAAAEAGSALQMLEKFLRTGMDARQAAGLLTPFLRLKGQGDSFVTLDVAVIDLFTGQGQLMKLGAAPTYLQHRGQVRCITCRTLPAGLSDECQPEVTPLTLSPGDVVALVSDGVADGRGDDAWLRQTLAAAQVVDVKALARQVVESAREGGGEDDMTCLVLRLV